MAARPAAALAAAALVVAALAAGGASAQSPSPSSSCTSVLVSLSPCLNYISGNVSAAPAPCCAQLGKVVQSDPQCLCVALNADPASLGLNVNRTRALGLPDACKVKTPPLSDCKKSQGGAPSGAPAGEPTTPAAPGSSGSTKSTPSTTLDNGASARGPAGSLVAGVVVAAVLAVAAM